jgi:predicted nuclease of predicted toxin-antitoxin system
VASLYLDNDVPARLARELRRFGHTVTTTRARQLQRAGDERQLLTTAQQSEILVTCNREDFFLLHDAW